MFASIFYWLLSSDPNSVFYAFSTLILIPLTTALLWALSYFLAGSFWENSSDN
jgi:hypothetical protein